MRAVLSSAGLAGSDAREAPCQHAGLDWPAPAAERCLCGQVTEGAKNPYSQLKQRYERMQKVALQAQVLVDDIASVRPCHTLLTVSLFQPLLTRGASSSEQALLQTSQDT